LRWRNRPLGDQLVHQVGVRIAVRRGIPERSNNCKSSSKIEGFAVPKLEQRGPRAVRADKGIQRVTTRSGSKGGPGIPAAPADPALPGTQRAKSLGNNCRASSLSAGKHARIRPLDPFDGSAGLGSIFGG